MTQSTKTVIGLFCALALGAGVFKVASIKSFDFQHSKAGMFPAKTSNVQGDRSVEQISLKNRTTEQAMQAWWNRREHDRQADWKVPIRFYGRVVDQNMLPISGANIEFQWTDLSLKGMSKRKMTSDSNGYFSLRGVTGKNLGVYVSKQGYLTPTGVRARAFEFADPAEKNYHQPNPNNPVLFYLRKRGEGSELIHKSVRLLLPGDGTAKNIDLTTGKQNPNGQLQLQTWKPWPPRPMSPHYDWKLVLTLADGGFTEAHEEFPFEAPETVYEPTFEVNMPATLNDAWKVSAEKTLYFTYGSPKKYGRLTFRTDGNSRYIFIDYFLNPSGSRNLEPAAAAASSIQ